MLYFISWYVTEVVLFSWQRQGGSGECREDAEGAGPGPLCGGLRGHSEGVSGGVDPGRPPVCCHPGRCVETDQRQQGCREAEDNNRSGRLCLQEPPTVSGAVFVRRVCFSPSVCVSFEMLYSGVISNKSGDQWHCYCGSRQFRIEQIKGCTWNGTYFTRYSGNLHLLCDTTVGYYSLKYRRSALTSMALEWTKLDCTV